MICITRVCATAAAVARGSGCSAKPRQRRRAGAFRTLGYARPIVQIAPERSRAMVRRILSTADRQGAEEVAHRKAHLRASARPDLKRWGHRGAPKGHMSGVQRGPTVPPSPYRLGSIASWESISAAAPAGRVVRKEYVYTVHVPHTLHDTVLHRPHDCADGAHARAAPSDTPSRVQARLRRRRRRHIVGSVGCHAISP